ncbi:uncharacterized protein ACLA_056000 [Aspergillus clavatus NRRL 1]|uniref:DUF7703 domain-containing protein n=1 Tax=Aspergillus clavatus (strain ATCC 1007 / CBS 513.65 / DSM 816 / NCTC 3887 / NRRL 1 / QM 1276 / 107) TaxID=344612 RepID=A1C9M8_ASPCL|nr:uncharacterized protein ACLA_056000 [Aspergillus clavatus NRRL 1]EAW13552.1 conserved hypothetical protein [Aspergillus clavatus NRRL 1]
MPPTFVSPATGLVTQPYGASTLVMVGFISVACYNCLEMFVLIFDFFQTWRGVYFWSMQVATWGLATLSVFLILQGFSLAPLLVNDIGLVLGSIALSVGSCIMLYSRLHLIVEDARRIRWVLWLIIINICSCDIPIIVFLIAIHAGASNLIEPGANFAKFSAVAKSVVQLIIACIYIYEAIRNLKPIVAMKGPAARRVLLHLIGINVFIVMSIISLVVMFFLEVEIRQFFIPFVQSVNLKLEFNILNKLVTLLQSPSSCQHSLHGCHIVEETTSATASPAPNEHTSVFSKTRRGSDHPVRRLSQEPPGLWADESCYRMAALESQPSISVSVLEPPRALSSDHLIYNQAVLEIAEATSYSVAEVPSHLRT